MELAHRKSPLCDFMDKNENNTPLSKDSAHIVERLENMVLEYIKQIARGEAPELRCPIGKKERPNKDEIPPESSAEEIVNLRNYLPLEALSEGNPDISRHYRKWKLNGFNALRHGRMWAASSFAHRTLLSGRERTLRAAFYSRLDVFKHQGQLDSSVHNLASALGVKRRNLGIVASPRGSIAGPIRFIKTGCVIGDATEKPIMIHEMLSDPDVELETSARYLIIVEKEGILTHLQTSQFTNQYASIVITGNGFPPYGVQKLARRVSQELKLPTYGLFDCNPHGIAIMLRYKYGFSRVHDPSMSNLTVIGDGFEGHADLAIRNMKWIGMRHNDLEDLLPLYPESQDSIPSSPCELEDMNGKEMEFSDTPNRLGDNEKGRIDELPLSDLDVKIASRLMQEAKALGEPEVLNALEQMLQKSTKFEIQSVMNFRWDYLTEDFLPSMMTKESSWYGF